MIGLVFAILQLWRTKRATIAATDAAAKTVKQNMEHFNRYAAANARSMLKELSIRIDNRDWKLAAVRADDLADLAMQISHVVTDSAEDWHAAATNLRGWKSRFSEVDRNVKSFEGTLESKWRKYVDKFARQVDEYHRPFTDAGGGGRQ